MEFVHLHNHSDYSILDGALTIKKMVDKAVEFGMGAVALTDHGNMFGAIEFYQTARKAGITPIIGQEFYVAPGSRFKKEVSRTNGDDASYHLILLAKNQAGYKNLMKLSSIGYLEGFYYRPRIDMEILEKHSEGLICSTACIAGEIPVHILKGRLKEARELAGRYSEIFGKENFYLEMQYHGLKEQETVNRELVKMSAELNIPLIVTNDSHYPSRDDAYSHEVLLCVQTGKTIDDPNRMRFSNDQFYFKSPEEMRKLFSDYPDSLYNTYKISQMVDLEIELGKAILPHFEVPKSYDLDSYLTHLVYEGAAKRFTGALPDEVKKRIEFELNVIRNMKFSGYFLVVWDFINFARSKHVAVGPGRGSAAGSMVSYCLGITALNPLKYNLLFERFLNPDRNEMPDMDIDFCADRREEVIDYVKEKYGADHVSQIITFNRMKAKAVVKDVARVLNIPFSRANEISKLIDEKELKDLLKSNSEFKKQYDKGDIPKELVDISLRLEGLARSAGKHAAGVVISRGPLTDYVPLYKDPKEGGISSQYEKNTLEKAGLVKMDFLGLKNLSIIEKCIKLIEATTGKYVEIEDLPLDDKDTFTLLQKANTKGIFQLESAGMQNLLRRLGPTDFEDIIAIVALFRPGPLGSGMADDFITRKRHPDQIAYPHPTLEPVLKDTLGVVVYQEQVMLISQVIAGFTMPEADKLRKAMGKKDASIIDDLEGKFLKGAEKKGIDKKLAENLYSMIKKFGEYGFNKSHSAAYALVTYQTAFLKTHYPIQYMTALLSAQPEQNDITAYINDCRMMGISVLPPSINDSGYDFTIEGNAIRFGLKAIKGLGEKAIEIIIRTRNSIGKFSNMRDFLENVELGVVNKGVLEALVKSGALDAIIQSRGRLFNSIDYIIDAAKRMQEERITGQGNLFGGGDKAVKDDITVELPEHPDWPDNIRLGYEKEVLGLYVSGHPLSKFEKEIRIFSSASINEIDEEFNGREISVVGMINNLQFRKSQKGHRWAIAVFEDLDSQMETLFFAKTLSKFEQMLTTGEPLMLTGTIECEGENQKKMMVNNVRTLKEVRREAVSAIHIRLDPIGIDETVLDSLKGIFERHKGDCPIFFHVKEREGEKIIKAHKAYGIKPSEFLIKDLSQIVGGEAVRFSIGRH